MSATHLTLEERILFEEIEDLLFQQKLGGFPSGLPRCAGLNNRVPRVTPHARNSMAFPSSTPNTPSTKTRCWLTETD